MAKVTNQKMVSKLEAKFKTGATSAFNFAKKQKLSHFKAQLLKMTICIVCYTAAIIGMLVLWGWEAAGPPTAPDIAFTNTQNPLYLKFQLKDCLVDVEPGEEAGLHFYPTTADSSAGKSLELTGAGTADDVLNLLCVGPSNEAGDDETMILKVGPDVKLQSLEVSFEANNGMIRARNIHVAERFDVRGPYGIVQLDGTQTTYMAIQLDQGYVGLVNTQFSNASLVLGEEVDLYSWSDMDNPGMEVKIETVEPSNESQGFCVSDNTSKPVLQVVNEETHDVFFTLGLEPRRQMEITRKTGMNRLVFSHGVWMSDRNCNNTFDTFLNTLEVPPELGFAFKTWAKQAYTAGMEIMNLWLVGSGLGLDTQSAYSTGMWIFTTTGAGLLWCPMQIWQLFTLGIMQPRAVRQVAIVKDYTCLSSYAKLVQGKGSCTPVVTSESAIVSNLKRVQASAIRNSLPEELNLTNAPNSRIYYVEDVPVNEQAWPSLADGKVSILTTQTGAFVKKVTGRAFFHGLVGSFFIAALVFLPIVGGVFACVLIAMLYKMEKRRYLRARGTEKPRKKAWASAGDSPKSGATRTSVYSSKFGEEAAEQIQDYLEAEARSNLLLTLVRCLVLRSPAGGNEMSVKQVCQVVLGHFIVMQLLVAPFVLVSILTVNNVVPGRPLCSHNSWAGGACVSGQLRSFSIGMLTVAIVFESIFFLNSVLEYTTRYALDMLESTGSAPRCYLRLMHLRQSKVYSKMLSAIQAITLFTFCGYFILVAMFIMLGTLLHPQQLAPVLLSIAGAAVVGQQITVKFNEIVENAKKWAANMLQKAESFVKDGEAMIKGVAGDVLGKVPGGEKMSAMLDNAISVDKLLEKGAEQVTQAIDSVNSPEDLHRLYQAGQEAASKGFAYVGSAAQMVKGIGSNNVSDIVKMLQAMASKNPQAATQMLQAALSSHRESGLLIIKELVAGNPSAAGAVLKGVGGDTLASVAQELPPEQAQLLKEATKAVGVDLDSGEPVIEMTEVKVVGAGDVPGAVTSMEDVSSPMGIAESLQELMGSNPDAASQMLQALSGNSKTGAKIMQEMAVINPSSAVQMVKGLARLDLDTAVQMIEALSGTEQAKYLESGMAEAGIPINMAELTKFKAVAEEARKFAANFTQAALPTAAAAGQEEVKPGGNAQRELSPEEVQKGEEAAADMQENILMMLGLSKGQLILLNIQAVLLFLSWVGFMLMGSYLFLGSEALLPQLISNVSAVGSAVTMIRSRSSELQSGDLKSVQNVMQAASGELTKKPAAQEEKKNQ